MTTKVAIRVGIEGKAEVKQTFTEMARDGQAALGTVEQGAEKVGAAIDRNTARFTRMAAAARQAPRAEEAQARFNSVLGVGGGSGKLASDSAAVFENTRLLSADANVLRATLDSLGAATDRQTERFNRMAAAARQAATAEQAQSRFNAVLGVGGGSGKSASESAAIFEADDRQAKMAAAIRAELDPLRAAQDRYNDELERTQRLKTAGHLTDAEFIAWQNRLQVELDQTTAAIARNSRGLTRLALASRLNLTRQAADVAVTAAMGMNPAMIAIQQGPQILDALATSGIKAQGSLLLLGGAVTAAAAGVAILGAAWLNGEAGALQMDRAVTGLGRTSGLTAEHLDALARAGAEQGEVSIRSARDQAAAYVSTGKIGREVMVDLIAVGRDYASVFGLEAEDATQALAKAMAEPDKAARELTRQIGLMDQKTLDHIDTLVKLGREQEAQKILLDELTEAVKGHGDQISEVTNLWDAAGRAVSNYWDKLGRALYTTPDERLANLDRALIDARDRESRGIRLRPGFIQELEAERAELLRGQLDDQRRVAANADAAENQAAQEDRDRRDRAPKSRRDRSAEREARERETRRRAEEERAATLELEISRAIGDIDHVRVLEDEAAVRRRIRDLVDDEVPAAEAKTRALEEQARLTAAREVQDDRALIAQQRTQGIEYERLLGNERFAANLERISESERLVAAYQEAGLDAATAENAAKRDLLELEQARAEVLKGIVRDADREHRLTLARLRGDDRTSDALERDQRIDARAREIEARLRLNRGEGVSAARRQIDEEIAAAATGARRAWLHGFASDIKQSGIKAALIEQFDIASDRFLRNLIDGLAAIDWTSVFGGGKGSDGGFGGFLNAILGGGSGKAGGKGGGGFGDFLNFILGGGKGGGKGAGKGVGANADGTDDWPGGLTWVGERGRELVNLPRGSQVFSAPASLTMASRTAGAGAAPISVPVTIMAQDVQSFRASKSQIAAQIARAVRSAQRVD